MDRAELITRAGFLMFRKFRNVRVVREFVENRYRFICTNRPLHTRNYYDFNLHVPPNDAIGHSIYFYGRYDERTTNFIDHYVREGDVCWDIGAHYGWFTLLMGKRVGLSGRVDAFEASPTIYSLLRENVDCNDMPQINLIPKAISNQNGTAQFVTSDMVYKNRETQVQETWKLENSGLGYLKTNVEDSENKNHIETIRLDDYAKETGLERLDFIKMDIEGGEFNALVGAEKTITSLRPIIIVEYNNIATNRAGYDVEDLDNLLSDYNYDRYIGIPLKRLNIDGFINRQNSDAFALNVFCFPK